MFHARENCPIACSAKYNSRFREAILHKINDCLKLFHKIVSGFAYLNLYCFLSTLYLCLCINWLSQRSDKELYLVTFRLWWCFPKNSRSSHHPPLIWSFLKTCFILLSSSSKCGRPWEEISCLNHPPGIVGTGLYSHIYLHPWDGACGPRSHRQLSLARMEGPRSMSAIDWRPRRSSYSRRRPRSEAVEPVATHSQSTRAPQLKRRTFHKTDKLLLISIPSEQVGRKQGVLIAAHILFERCPILNLKPWPQYEIAQWVLPTLSTLIAGELPHFFHNLTQPLIIYDASHRIEERGAKVALARFKEQRGPLCSKWPSQPPWQIDRRRDRHSAYTHGFTRLHKHLPLNHDMPHRFGTFLQIHRKSVAKKVIWGHAWAQQTAIKESLMSLNSKVLMDVQELSAKVGHIRPPNIEYPVYSRPLVSNNQSFKHNVIKKPTILDWVFG